MARDRHRVRFAVQMFLCLLLITLTGCKSNKGSTRTFASPDEAGSALQAAAQTDNEAALQKIFGADAMDVISSGDTVQDKNTARAFSAAYDVMHRWRAVGDDKLILLVGYDNFAFPIPLQKNPDGKWFFDTAAGKDEVLNRRIGRNELAIIDVCNAIAHAQASYFSQLHDDSTTRQYAPKFISDSGKHNGLYWEPAQEKLQSPLGPLAAFATAEGYAIKPDAHAPFHGYGIQRFQVKANIIPVIPFLVRKPLFGGE